MSEQGVTSYIIDLAVIAAIIQEGVVCFQFIFFNQLFQTDKSGDLDVVEVFKLEHYVAVARREYVESYERRNPASITQTQMKKTLSVRGNTFYLQQCRNNTQIEETD